MDTSDQNIRAERIEALGRLAAGVAHDFNNVLTVILGYSELLTDTLAADDETRPIIADIADAARRGRRLTRDLMLFSGWQPARPQVVSVADQITALSCRLRRLAPAQVSLTLSVPDPALRVMSDPEQLSELVMNLAERATSVMSGGGELRIEASRHHVAQQMDAMGTPAVPGDYVRIRVRDTGAGMDAATRARLFEPFFTTKKAGQGAGLRMAAVFGIARTCGGFLTVQSGTGEGSTIDVYLPLAQEPGPQGLPSASAPSLASCGRPLEPSEDSRAIVDLPD